jgi:hypothetical protein
VTLDSQKLFDVEDSTFTEAGKTGLCIKADSVHLLRRFSGYGISQEVETESPA